MNVYVTYTMCLGIDMETYININFLDTKLTLNITLTIQIQRSIIFFLKIIYQLNNRAVEADYNKICCD